MQRKNNQDYFLFLWKKEKQRKIRNIFLLQSAFACYKSLQFGTSYMHTKNSAEMEDL